MSTRAQEDTVKALAEVRAALSGCEGTLDYLRGRVESPAALDALHDLLIYTALDAVDEIAKVERARLRAAELAALAEREAA